MPFYTMERLYIHRVFILLSFNYFLLYSVFIYRQRLAVCRLVFVCLWLYTTDANYDTFCDRHGFPLALVCSCYCPDALHCPFFGFSMLYLWLFRILLEYDRRYLYWRWQWYFFW